MITHNKNGAFTGYVGNRLFQFASTIGIATKHGMDCKFLPNDYVSGFKNIPLANHREFNGMNFVARNETGFGYEEFRLHPGQNYDIQGYRQSLKYWIHCEELVRRTFEFKDDVEDSARGRLSEIKRLFPEKKLVSLHLRLGDYLNLKDHHTCLTDTEYYQNSIRTFDLENTLFVVFNNDMRIATDFMMKLSTQINHLSFHVIQHCDPFWDMCLMSKMDAHIIANSSYSWWGAYLGEHHASRIISPMKARWFGPAYKDMNVNDVIPERWEQMRF